MGVREEVENHLNTLSERDRRMRQEEETRRMQQKQKEADNLRNQQEQIALLEEIGAVNAFREAAEAMRSRWPDVKLTITKPGPQDKSVYLELTGGGDIHGIYQVIGQFRESTKGRRWQRRKKGIVFEVNGFEAPAPYEKDKIEMAVVNGVKSQLWVGLALANRPGRREIALSKPQGQ